MSSLCKQGRGQVSSESAARLALQQAARATRAAGPQKRARYGLRSRSKRILRAPLRHRPCSAQRYARVRILSDKSCGRTRSTQCDVAAEFERAGRRPQMGLRETGAHRALVRSIKVVPGWSEERRGVVVRRRVEHFGEHLKEGTTSFLPTTSFCPPIENKNSLSPTTSSGG